LALFPINLRYLLRKALFAALWGTLTTSYKQWPRRAKLPSHWHVKAAPHLLGVTP